MSLLVITLGGPIQEAFEVDSCPKVVRCVRSTDGKTDILNLPDDQPAPNETAYWYRFDPEQGVGFACRGRGGGYKIVHYVHAPGLDVEQPPEGQLALVVDGRQEAG